MSYAIIQLLNGIQYGIILALIAAGLSLIFGMLGILNFAHGALYMLGAYLFWTFLQINIPGIFWFALILAFLGMGFVGLICEQTTLKKVYGEEHIYQFLLTFGIALVIQHGLPLIWGYSPMIVKTPDILQGTVNWGFFTYPIYYIFVMITGLLIIFIVWVFIERSSWGAIMRACAEDSETASCLGIQSRKVYAGTFALGTALTGLSGGLYAPVAGNLSTGMGVNILLGCFVVLIVGGTGKIGGALLAGIIIGVLRGLCILIWAPAADLSLFIFMFLVLLFRPQGLFGRKL